MKIGIDVDGVLLEKELRTRAELYDLLELNGKGILNTNKFNLEERYGWNKDVGKKFVKKQKLKENKYLKEVNLWGEIYRYVYSTEKR